MTSYTFKKSFNKNGKQGFTGILNDKNNNQVVYKVSQYLDHLIKHEQIISKSLTTMRQYCPHFCNYISMVKKNVDINYKDRLEESVEKYHNIFDIKGKYSVKVNALLLEYIQGKKMESVISNREVSDDILINTIKQVLIAIYIAQTKLNFTHYDLHSANIILKKCDVNSINLYVLSDKHSFCVPTGGYYPVIFDYGYSYCKELEGNPIYSSLAHTEVGFMTNLFDPIADSKLFLLTSSSELIQRRNSKKFVTLRNIVRNIFEPLSVDLESGWDDMHHYAASDMIYNKVKDIEISSSLFTDKLHLCIDLIESLITLPLRNKGNTKTITKSFQMMVSEFSIIEKEINDTTKSLYVFKKMIDSCNKNKSTIYKSLKTKNKTDYLNAIQQFTRDIYHAIREVTSFCSPKNINFEKLLCSVLSFSKSSEKILYDTVKSQMKQKLEEYNKMKIQSPLDIFSTIEYNLPSSYKFTRNTIINVYDIPKQSNYSFQLYDQDVELLTRRKNVVSIFNGILLKQFYMNRRYNKPIDRNLFPRNVSNENIVKNIPKKKKYQKIKLLILNLDQEQNKKCK